ncbi:MAG: hypothetical protein OEW75_06675 [Cyclobacteriaceae bacterium]|nr:hypothetical protein [Cyclobacteriaceae bacterium]
MSFCFNYSDYDLQQIWYYEGVSALLNEYICEKVDNGELQNKKFEISLGCIIFGGHPSIHISKSSQAYYVFVHDEPNLEYIARIIDEFTIPKWQSFTYHNDPDKMELDTVMKKRYNHRLDRNVPKPNLSFFKNKSVPLIQLDELCLDFFETDLRLTIHDKVIDGEVVQPPLKVRDRYVVNINDTLKIIDNLGNVLKEIAIIKPSYSMDSEFIMKVFGNWVNYYYWKTPLISYNYENNRFYRVDREEKK